MRAAVLQFMTGPLCDASEWMMHVLAGGSVVAVDASVLTSVSIHFENNNFSLLTSHHTTLGTFKHRASLFVKKLNSSVKECDIFLCIE